MFPAQTDYFYSCLSIRYLFVPKLLRDGDFIKIYYILYYNAYDL